MSEFASRWSSCSEENTINIVFSSSNYYTPYLTTALYSLSSHTSPQNKYHIFILHSNISDNNKNIILHFIAKENIKIDFINVSNMFPWKHLQVSGHLSIETYFRLIIPEIFRNYKKIIFLDSDIIVQDDIQKLFNINIDGYPLAATEESLLSAQISIPENKNFKSYIINTLGIKNTDMYFQAGVMLINIPLFIKYNYDEEIIKMISQHSYKIADQDVLNQLLWDKYLLLDKEWNWTPMQKHMINLSYIELMPASIRKRYIAVTDPKIIHYADRNKPWNDPEENYATVWWNYARKTPYYEILLLRMSKYSIINEEIDVIWKSLREKYILYKIIKYKILYTLTFGKRKIHYQKKVQKYVDIYNIIQTKKNCHFSNL